MKTEQEVIKRMKELTKLIEDSEPRKYKRAKLIHEYSALHWVLFE